jgi:hypothetical protein
MSAENTRLWKLFDAGRAADSLRGSGSYFVADVTYRNEHDRILVIGQMLDWAQTRGLPDAVLAAVSLVVEAAVEELEFDAALDTLLTYGLVRRDRDSLDQQDIDFLGHELDRVLHAIPSRSTNKNRGPVVESIRLLLEAPCTPS